MFGLGLFVGVIIGAPLGIFIIALVSANNRTHKEDDYERFERKD